MIPIPRKGTEILVISNDKNNKFRFVIPIPRKGTESCSKMISAVLIWFVIPIPRKGTETSCTSQSCHCIPVCDTYSPQGDGNTLIAAIVYTPLRFVIPIPRKGTETVKLLRKKYGNRKVCDTYSPQGDGNMTKNEVLKQV